MAKIFSARAECKLDVSRFEELLAKAGLVAHVRMTPYSRMPDVRFELRSLQEVELETLRAVVRKVPDGHVMLQTLRAEPLARNKLERDYELR